MFSRVGAVALKNDLYNTTALLKALDNPHLKFKAIHIAGTNGKGSTSHMLAAILQSAGYKVGLYTSPHLSDFRERIRVNGTMCSKDFVIRFVKTIQPLLPTLQPSFFEITVAMAFEYFATCQVDIAVIETGLGGRLDSTNIINPLLSIITNISKDHVQILGDSLEEIAYAKAGIIKRQTPVIIGEIPSHTHEVFDREAQLKSAPIYYTKDYFFVESIEQHINSLDITLQQNLYPSNDFSLDLTGRYQAKNVQPVLLAVHLLKQMHYTIPVEAIKKGLAHTKQLTGLFGRWEQIQQHPTIIADVGHNEDGIRQIIENIAQLSYQQLHIVVGFVKDKDINTALQLLPKEAQYYFTKAPLERALDEVSLQQLAQKHSLNGDAYPSVSVALEQAKRKASTDDIIIVCGSVFIVAELHASLQKLS